MMVWRTLITRLRRAANSFVFGPEQRACRRYGHTAIFRQYAGVKLHYNVPMEIQHGWYGRPGVYDDLHYAWSKRNLEWASDAGHSNVVAVGAPFLYLPPPDPEANNALGERSLLLFPLHSSPSTPYADAVGAYREYIQSIRELLDIFSPVTVCLFWFDYQYPGVLELFEDQGIQVVTLGQRLNPSFLKDFRDLTAPYAYVSSNTYCTAVFYALYMRKKAFVCGKLHHRSGAVPGRTSNYDVYSEVYPELLWQNFHDASHYWIGEYELGLELKRSPTELRTLFGWTASNLARQVLRRLLLQIGRRFGLSLTRTIRTPGSPLPAHKAERE